MLKFLKQSRIMAINVGWCRDRVCFCPCPISAFFHLCAQPHRVRFMCCILCCIPKSLIAGIIFKVSLEHSENIPRKIVNMAPQCFRAINSLLIFTQQHLSIKFEHSYYLISKSTFLNLEVPAMWRNSRESNKHE